MERVSLSIVFVTDREIQTLNKKFLNRNYATDVLAFDLTERGLSYAKHKRKLRRVSAVEGDIIISTDTVFRNAKIYQKSPYEEVILCVVHGILHLLGYDDHAPADIRRMREKEEQLMNYLKKKSFL